MMLTFVICLLLMGCAQIEAFSSVQSVSETFNAESHVVKQLESAMSKVKEQMKVMDRYTGDFEKYWKNRTRSGVSLEHPINGYLWMKRLVKEWSEVKMAATIIQNVMRGTLTNIKQVRDSMAFPKEEDLTMVSKALLDMQSFYKQDVRMLSEGKVRDVRYKNKVFETSETLSSEDCEYLAALSANRSVLNGAVLWYQETLRRAQKEGRGKAEEKRITKIMNDTMAEHDTMLINLNLSPKTVLNPRPFNPILQDAALSAPTPDEETSEVYEDLRGIPVEVLQKRLCRGEKVLSDTITKSLKCQYITYGHPYFHLRPLKLEEYSNTPYIVAFHDFMSRRETENIVREAIPHLAPSTFLGEEDDSLRAYNRRSENAWLQNSNVTNPVSRRIELATGLHVVKDSSSEYYQVANYAIGGEYKRHGDFYRGESPTIPPEMLAEGDRIATFMVYLSNVQAGGATVFPHAGLTVWPQRGTAVFWWNLYRSMEGDYNTFHTGCPVLRGSKWIANKWIHEYDQAFVAKCGLDYDDQFGPEFLERKL